METIGHELGNAIKTIRKNRGYLQKDVADALDIPVTTYSNYENDIRMPNVDMLAKIANILNVPVNIFFYKNWYEEFNDYINSKTPLIHQYCSIDVIHFRREYNISQEQLAEAAKLPVEIIDAFEHDRIDDPAIYSNQIRNGLAQLNKGHRSYDEIAKLGVSEYGSPFPPPPLRIQKDILLSYFGQLNDDGQKVAIDRIKEMFELTKYTIEK